MGKMKIFLISGKAKSGKGEVAKIIKEYYIYKLENSVITQFSKYLKMFARELTEWDGSEATKPRKYLQNLAKSIRKIDVDYFINNMLEDMDVYAEFVDNVIISDVRMPKEIEILKDSYENVYSIHVENQFGESDLSVDEQIDITEVALDNYTNFDFIIVNDDLAKLKDKVFKILEGIE